MAIPVLISLAYLAAIILFSVKSKGESLNMKHAIAVLLGGALFFRLIAGFFMTGYEVDINTFKAWASLVNQVGYGEIYHQGVFLDYPPGYLYILGFLDSLRQLFSLDQYSPFYTLMIKLPSILADIGCGYLIYRIGKNRIGETQSLFIAAAYLFCPAVLINSTTWGQADSFTTLLLLVSLLLLYKGKTVPAAVVYGVAVICKPQALIFAPVFLFYTLFKKNFKGFFLGIIAGILTIMLIATPFIKDFNYLWLIDKYRETMDYYAYYSINAYNLWAMLGKNWGALPENGIGLFVLNWFGPVLATALCGVLMWKSKKRTVIFAAPAVLMATVYMFSVKMHERYLFPVLLFLLLCYAFTRDKRFIWLFGGFSFVHYLNVKYILYLNNTFIDSFSPQIILLSAAHMLLYGYMLWVLHRVFIKEKVQIVHKASVKPALKPQKEIKPLFPTENFSRKIKSADILIVAAITLVYGTVAFWNLGANTAANTSWTPEQGESAVFEVEGASSSLTYVSGIAANVYEDRREPRVGQNFSVEVSDDMNAWAFAGEVKESAVYEWKELPLTLTGRYVRLTATGSNTTLNEIAFKNTGGSGFLPVKAVSGGEALIDEQQAVPLHPSAYNSTYFDEIYHARTAYEHILGVEPYESTHPPLGKLIISLGIMIFGMNPFGWRFMGTLFGILMLPVFYHLLKRLFGRPLLCGVGTLLFAFDFMHFTQTRIATIDTYAVIFMLLMVDAMVVFIQQDILKAPMKKLLAPLLVSGIFMGIGVASKWTVAYAAVGLAVLFFGKLFVSFRENRDQKAAVRKRALDLCLWCVLLFITVPFAIYFCAFLPMTTLPQNRNNIFGSFIGYQTHMFNYHSTLVATHYFASPWYEWPLDIRNIWYFGNSNVDGMGGASTIVCLGNPLLWWSGLVALIGTIYVFIRERTQTAAVAVIGFAAAYLPWVLVPRLTFVYHYFTAVPFIVTALVYILQKVQGEGFMARSVGKNGILQKVTCGQVLIGVFVAVNMALFVAFYPALSGAASTTDYLSSLEWLPNWYFINPS